jgi:hypothetical protein
MDSQKQTELSPKEISVVARLKTVDECDQFILNMASNPKLVQAAIKRSIEIRLAAHTQMSQVVRDIWEVLYAYEEVLFIKHGKRLKANYTRRAIKSVGELGAVENIVSQRSDDDDGFARLEAAGLSTLTFEAVVLRHPQHFSAKAREQARSRLMITP